MRLKYGIAVGHGKLCCLVILGMRQTKCLSVKTIGLGNAGFVVKSLDLNWKTEDNRKGKGMTHLDAEWIIGLLAFIAGNLVSISYNVRKLKLRFYS